MLKGSIVALVTPMRENGEIDWETLAKLVEWHIESGTNAIVAMGTTGESATLDHEEHLGVVKFIVDCVKGRIPVIAGTGSNATSEAIAMTKSAYTYGCAASLQVVPYYNKPTQRGLYAHFKAIAEATPMPVILYNVPSRTGCDLLPETVAALAKVSNIIGIKEASTYERLEELKKIVPADFILLTGEDGLAAKAFVHDLVCGVISVTANVAPAMMAAMMNNRDQALVINEQLAPLHEAMFCECNPQPVKWALHHLGKIGLGIRLPLVPLAEEKHAQIISALQGVK